MTDGTASNCNTDEQQRVQLARILRDPAKYYAEARREAHEQARRFLETELELRNVQPAR